MTTILVNSIKCNHCGQQLISANRHDYNSCRCRKVSVDGGRDYLRRLYFRPEDYTELSTLEVNVVDFNRLVDSIKKYKKEVDNLNLITIPESLKEAQEILEDTLNQLK